MCRGNWKERGTTVSSSNVDHGDDDDDVDDDIYYDEVFVCLSVTKNEHFLLGVSCNHP